MLSAVRQVVLAASVLAAAYSAAPAMGQDSDAEAIAPLLLKHITNTREATMVKLMGVFRKTAGEDQVLTEADLDLHRQTTAANIRGSLIGQFIQRLLKHDLDDDGVVTRAEATQVVFATSTSKQYRDNQLKKLFDHDADGDDKLTIAEVTVAAREIYKTRAARGNHSQVIELFNLDPNGDKRLTGDELEGLLRQAFAMFDQDGNGALSDVEAQALSKAKRAMNAANRAAPRQNRLTCELPAADPGADVVLVGTYEAGTLSDVTVAGQDRVTETSRITVEPGEKPLYVVATSHTPNIWRFSGQVDRISRFVVFPQVGDKKTPNVGVIGLPKDRITYLPNMACFRYFKDAGSGAGRQAKALVENILKRPIKRVVGSYTMPAVALPSGVVDSFRDGRQAGMRIVTGDGDDLVIMGNKQVRRAPPSRGNRTPPPGVDRATFAELHHYSPGGVAGIQAEQVLAPGPVEDYVVLPQQAGLIQLMQEGLIERLSDGVYFVKKPIARFPAGLAGAHSVTFMLAKGVPMPAGHPGHSCVLSEETGKSLVGRGSSRCLR